jgi:hypothetical protein
MEASGVGQAQGSCWRQFTVRAPYDLKRPSPTERCPRF